MARFRAYASDSSDEDEEEYVIEPEKPQESDANDSSEDDEEEDEEDEEEEEEEGEETDGDEDDSCSSSSSSSSSSRLHEDDLIPKTRSRNALVVDEDGDYHFAHELPPQRNADPTIIPRAQALGVDSQRMHVMQASLFQMPEEAAALRAQQQQQRSSLNRKHSRDSDGDGLRFEPRERASFAHNIEPPIHRPTRKYARVESSASIATGHESHIVDAGLAFGRSFRAGWGPGGAIVHLGSLVGPSQKPKSSANSSTVNLTQVPLSSDPTCSLSSKLLPHHLSHSPIDYDEDGIPFATPFSTLTFSSFASLFSASDPSFEASLFRLGEALFDDIDLRLADTTSVDIRNQIECLARKARFSTWLEGAVVPLVELDLRSSLSSVEFTRLTGNQIEKATEAAIDAGNMKLATLVSQGAGGWEFQGFLRDQLMIWKEQKVDTLISEGIRKVYALLAGEVDNVFQGSARALDIDVLKGLDWKRVLGVVMWFAEPVESTLSDSFRRYEDLLARMDGRDIARPIPSWSSSLRHPDGMFSLIRLHADPACSLSHVLDPMSFGPSPVDYTLPWHLYIIMSRAMRVRDFADREDSGMEDVDGHSPSADLLASSYALQLEQRGLVQEALFVLLHIEGARGREKAIKDLLARSAPTMDEWVKRGIVGSLKIPMKWVDEAKAIYALQNDEMYEAYQLYLSAGLYSQAHDIAVNNLAPDAIIRKDLDLLQSLFSVFVGKPVDGWHMKGKLFLDYIDILTQLPQLTEYHDVIPDATQSSQMEDLTRAVPRIIRLLPDVFANRSDARHKVAKSEMTNELVKVVDRVRPLVLSKVQLPLVDEASKTHIQSTALGRFMKSIAVA